MVTTETCHASNDDKYAKWEERNTSLASKHSGLPHLPRLHFAQAGEKPFVICTGILFVCGLLWHGFQLHYVFENMGSVLEFLGLISLRCKISKRGSVKGVSGSCIGMYGCVYGLRALLLAVSPMSLSVKAMSTLALLMLLEIFWCVFKTYHHSYQEDLDVLKAKHLIPVCLLLALLVHPNETEDDMYSFLNTICLYVDVVALLPQVVMMSKGDGKVEAPIAHFVAATAISRGTDLAWYWLYEFPRLDLFSVCMVVVAHILQLVLSLDFLYYYLKARFSGVATSADLVLTI